MKNKYRLIFLALILIALGLFAALFFYGSQSAVLNPKGMIAFKQRQLILTTTLLMLIVVIPVFFITCIFCWKYRADRLEKYTPNWGDSVLAECIWWGLPFVIITILSIITWKSCHDLDPFKPIESDRKPMTIQVVALQWKWLFIYPEQKIATVNYLQFPEKTPIDFEITADAPMNSFWTPQLGGQIYAMPGMRTKLHLIAAEPGVFRGSSANLSGRGFAGMHFMAKASLEDEFDNWVQEVKSSSDGLTLDRYLLLAEPSENNPVETYVLKDVGLFEEIVMKYMMPM